MSLSANDADCIVSRSGSSTAGKADVVDGAASPDALPPDGAVFPDLSRDMLNAGGQAMTLGLRSADAPESTHDAELEVMRFADEPQASAALAKINGWRDATGATDGAVVIYDLYRAGRMIVMISGARPLTERERTAVDQCLGVSQPVQRPRAPISGGTDTTRIAACLRRLADRYDGELIDRKRPGASAPPAYLASDHAVDVPAPDAGELKGLWTLRLGARPDDRPPKGAGDLYLFPSQAKAEHFAAQLEDAYDSFDPDQTLRAFEPFGAAVLLLYGDPGPSAREADALKACARA